MSLKKSSFARSFARYGSKQKSQKNTSFSGSWIYTPRIQRIQGMHTNATGGFASSQDFQPPVHGREVSQVAFFVHGFTDLREYLFSPYACVSHVLLESAHEAKWQDMYSQWRKHKGVSCDASPVVWDVVKGSISGVSWLKPGEDYHNHREKRGGSLANEEVRFQGCLARVCLNVYQGFEHWLSSDRESLHSPEGLCNVFAKASSPEIVVVLDHLQDPRNFGSIIRTSAFFGARSIVFAKDRQVPVTSAVVSSSRCGLGYVPLVEVVNISRTLAELQKAGYWVLGGDMQGEDLLEVRGEYDKIALVLGSEGSGISPAVRKRCDRMVRVPGQFSSLNVAVAAGILMHGLIMMS